MSLSFVTRSNAGARLTEVANTAANGEQNGVRYTLALDDQRTEAVEESGAKWQYGYDNLKQLVTTKFRGQSLTRQIRLAESDQTDTQASVIPPLDQSYAYDPMGNRRTYADQVGSTAYTTNNANQYTAVGGVASVYDHNGNLLTDGVKNYTWDAENQLTSVTPVNPTEGSAKVEYTYDWRMRRTGKKSYTYTAGNWVLTKTTGFKYHEWNLIHETATDFTTPSSPLITAKQYIWGNDLSGGIHGAGGVGGLLAMKYNSDNYLYAYDGNGNVRALVKADAGNPAASGIMERYAYDGFGRELPSSTPVASRLSPFAFSTKYLDYETDMNCYGYRYYAAYEGRWINRDPSAENGEINLYAMTKNNTITQWDFNGLAADKINADPVYQVGDSAGNYATTFFEYNVNANAILIKDYCARIEIETTANVLKMALSSRLFSQSPTGLIDWTSYGREILEPQGYTPGFVMAHEHLHFEKAINTADAIMEIANGYDGKVFKSKCADAIVSSLNAHSTLKLSEYTLHRDILDNKTYKIPPPSSIEYQKTRVERNRNEYELKIKEQKEACK